MKVTTSERPDWKVWALGIAAAVAQRGDCTRRRVGAVILDRQHRIIGAGYNGTMPGGPSCLKGDCPRGRHRRAFTDNPLGPIELCACGVPWPCPSAVAPGSSYDTGPGACIASHAEQSALADVEARYRLNGATIYVTEEPCGGCLKQIKNTTEIVEIAWPERVIRLR